MLVESGYEAVHVCDIGMTSAPDLDVWEVALQRNAAIVSKDEDFVLIGQARSDLPAPAVVWIRIGNCSRKALLDAVRSVLPLIVDMLVAGEKVVEVR